MPITRSIVAHAFGQSYARFGYNESAAYQTFIEACRRVIVTSSATITTNTGVTVGANDLPRFRNQAVDGSAILEANAGSSGFWVNNDKTTAGPLLTTALSTLSSFSPKPLFTIWSHGEQDVLSITTQTQAENVRDAVRDVLWPQMRAGIDSVDPDDVPIWVDMIGPRFAGSEFGEYLLRDQMIDLIDATANTYRGAEKYALLLDNTTHPSRDLLGYGRMGAYTGRKVAAWLVDKADEVRGPSINSGSVVKSGASVTVPITVPAGKTLIKPASPQFFGLFDASENRVPITGYSWSGDTLTLTAANTTATRLRYPARESGFADINRIVRLSNPSSADRLFVGEPGLPLESAKTIVL